MGTVNSPFTWVMASMGLVLIGCIAYLAWEKWKKRKSGDRIEQGEYWDEDDVHFT